MSNIETAYAAAVEQFGQERADSAAAISVEAFNAMALAGADVEACEAEQLAAFAAELSNT